MFEYFSRYWFDFVKVMTLKEIKARYKRVFLGFLWIFLNPILQMLVIGFLFRFFVPVSIDNYFYFLFAGLLPWNFFSYSVNKCTTIILNERSLIQKAKFPREALVLSIVFSNFFHFLISLFIFSMLVLFMNWMFITKLAYLLFAVVWLVSFVIGMSLLLATLFVRYRDIKFIVQATLPLLFYATPIIYTRDLFPSWVSRLLQLNPMTGIIELFQYVFVLSDQSFNIDSVVISMVFSAVIIFLGIFLFKRDNEFFDDWL